MQQVSFACIHCPKKYQSKQSLVRHVKEKHSGNPDKVEPDGDSVPNEVVDKKPATVGEKRKSQDELDIDYVMDIANRLNNDILCDDDNAMTALAERAIGSVENARKTVDTINVMRKRRVEKINDQAFHDEIASLKKDIIFPAVIEEFPNLDNNRENITYLESSLREIDVCVSQYEKIVHDYKAFKRIFEMYRDLTIPTSRPFGLILDACNSITCKHNESVKAFVEPNNVLCSFSTVRVFTPEEQQAFLNK